jgi:hypothetical protein
VKNKKPPELHTYRELSLVQQISINEVLIDIVRDNCRHNIILPNDAEPYNHVKIISVSFEKEAAAIWIHFETKSGEKIAIPIDFISSIEIAGPMIT